MDNTSALQIQYLTAELKRKDQKIQELEEKVTLVAELNRKLNQEVRNKEKVIQDVQEQASTILAQSREIQNRIMDIEAYNQDLVNQVIKPFVSSPIQQGKLSSMDTLDKLPIIVREDIITGLFDLPDNLTNWKKVAAQAFLSNRDLLTIQTKENPPDALLHYLVEKNTQYATLGQFRVLLEKSGRRDLASQVQSLL